MLKTKKQKVTMMSVSPMIFDSRIQNEAHTLSTAGHQITIIFVDDQKYNSGLSNPEEAWQKYLESMGKIKSVRVWLWSRQWTFLPRPLRMLMQAIEMFLKLTFYALKHRGSVYHCHDLTPALFCMIGSFIYRAELVYDAHELELEQGNKKGLHRKLAYLHEKLTLWWSSAAITVNDQIADQMQTTFGGNQVHVLENRPRYLTVAENRSHTFPAYKGHGPDAKFIVYVGYLNEGRGVMEVVAGLKHLPSNFIFLILGTGRIAEFRAQVMTYAKKIDVDENRVVFVDPVEPDKVVPFVSHADVSVVLLKGTNSNNFSVSPNKYPTMTGYLS
jgi:glycosyltransferase involved in cell wall biosynthesis